MTVKRVGDIEVDQDLAFQRREWRFERAGWVLIGLVVVLAALGLFGSGPLSSATAGSDDAGLTVAYQRFVRHTGEGEVTIRIDARHARDGQVEVQIDGTYLAGLQVRSVHPEPVEVRAGPDGLTYLFALGEDATELEVSLDFRPQEIGRIHGEVTLADGTAVAFSQFSYP